MKCAIAAMLAAGCFEFFWGSFGGFSGLAAPPAFAAPTAAAEDKPAISIPKGMPDVFGCRFADACYAMLARAVAAAYLGTFLAPAEGVEIGIGVSCTTEHGCGNKKFREYRRGGAGGPLYSAESVHVRIEHLKCAKPLGIEYYRLGGRESGRPWKKTLESLSIKFEDKHCAKFDVTYSNEIAEAPGRKGTRTGKLTAAACERRERPEGMRPELFEKACLIAFSISTKPEPVPEHVPAPTLEPHATSAVTPGPAERLPSGCSTADYLVIPEKRKKFFEAVVLSLDDEDSKDRDKAFAKLSDAHDIDTLARVAARDPRPAVRAEAVVSLGHLAYFRSDRKAREALFTLDDSDRAASVESKWIDQVGYFAVKGRGTRTSAKIRARARELVRSRMSSPHLEVRKAVLSILFDVFEDDQSEGLRADFDRMLAADASPAFASTVAWEMSSLTHSPVFRPTPETRAWLTLNLRALMKAKDADFRSVFWAKSGLKRLGELP